MRYGSVCSGIEAATAAWHPLGWEPAFFSEIDKFPCAVLQHHYPDVPLHGDFTTIRADQYGPIDLLVGGTPCQSFSVAGLRKGLDDDRGNLALEYLRLADRTRPAWVAWENVPGVLSSSGGRDFGSFLGALAELGYGFAYRVLNAQYFGVPQRRRRVFVVGYLGDWRPAAAVLFERHSLQGHPAPSREKGQGSAQCAKDGPGDGRWPAMTASTLNAAFGDKMGLEDQHALSGAPLFVPDYINALTAHNGARNEVSDILNGAVVSIHGTQDPDLSDVAHPIGRNSGQENAIVFSSKDHGGDAIEETSPTLRAGSHNGSHPNAGVPPAVALPINTQIAMRGGKTGKSTGFGVGDDGDPGFTLQAGHSHGVAFMENQRGELRTSDQTDALSTGGGKPGQGYAAAIQGMQVRRLTPIECERLQGFPDNYTRISWRNKAPEDCPDGPRYKALGNSMAVPVMRWIGERIQMVQHIST